MLTQLEERNLLLSDGPTGIAERAAIELSVSAADSADVLKRCREVMVVVLRHAADDWPPLSEWQRELPDRPHQRL